MTGKPLFWRTETIADVVRAIQQGEPLSAADYSDLNGEESLWQLLEYLWHRDLGKRFSIVEAIQRIEVWRSTRALSNVDPASALGSIALPPNSPTDVVSQDPRGEHVLEPATGSKVRHLLP